jgi:hypothetical protein
MVLLPAISRVQPHTAGIGQSQSHHQFEDTTSPSYSRYRRKMSEYHARSVCYAEPACGRFCHKRSLGLVESSGFHADRPLPPAPAGHRQSIHPFAHIGIAACRPDMRPRWQDDHPRSTASTRRKARGSIPASTRTVVPSDQAISIRSGGRAGMSGGNIGQGRHLDTSQAPDRLVRCRRLRRLQRLTPHIKLTRADAV